jgi:transcriptional regulator with XRE-family HTH domain
VTLAEQFGRNLFVARRRAGLTQAALAKAAGMERDSVQKIESGGRSVRLLTFLRLADALRIDPCRLLEGLKP